MGIIDSSEMKLKLQTRRLCLALAAAAVLAGGWLAIQAAPKPQAADTPAVQTAASAAAPVRTIGYTLVPLPPPDEKEAVAPADDPAAEEAPEEAPAPEEAVAPEDDAAGDPNAVPDDLELLDTIEFEGQTYCVFVPADIENMDVNDPDYGLIFLKSREENGEELFDSVDDDDELDRVYEYYQQIMEAEEEKE